MFKKTAIVAGVALTVAAGAQADYRWEADAAYQGINIDLGFDDGDVDRYAIGGAFFLNSVDTSKGPLSEAAFLDHASHVGIDYVYTDLDDIVEDLDGDRYSIDGRYVTDSAGWIFEGSYSRIEPDFSDIDTYTLGFGKYLTEATTLVASYWSADVDEGGDTDGYQLGVEHLWALSSSAIKLEGNYGFVDVDDADDIDIYNLTATWYPQNNVGVGATYGNFDANGGEADTWAVFAEFFVTENIALNASYSEADIDDTDIEIDTFEIGAKVRF